MGTFLVTGGAGFIGSHIVHRLVEQGHAVRVLDNFSTGRRENLGDCLDRLDPLEGSMLDASLCAKAVAGADVVFHEAAIPSVSRSIQDPSGTTENNVLGTVNLLTAAARANVRKFVYAASSSAYGDQPAAVKREDLLPSPLSPYAASKLAGEDLCRAFSHSFSLPTLCLRYFNIFGPRQDPNSPYSAVIPLFITALLKGERPKIYGDGLQSRDFTYVENAVQANLLAAESEAGSGETINIACGASHSLLDVLRKIADQLGVKPDPEFLPPRAGDVRHSLASIDKAGDLIGYTPAVDFDEGLRRTVEFFRQEFLGQRL